MSATYKSPIEHDPEYITLLGLISARWTLTEEALCMLFVELIGDEETARRVYLSQGGFRQRIEMVKAACAAQFEDNNYCDEMLAVLSRVYDHFKVRNRLMHSPYRAIVRTAKGERFSQPTLYATPDEGADTVLWIGQGHPNFPIRINKGAFKTHLEKLDTILKSIVELIWAVEAAELVEAPPEAPTPPPQRRKQSTPPPPQAGKARQRRARSSQT